MRFRHLDAKIFYSLLIACLLGCSNRDLLKIDFARRSILDLQTRMLTIRFDSTHFLAYDLGHGFLQKVWRGGVWWNGANFNNVKTIQPQSWGSVYWENIEREHPWKLMVDHQQAPLRAIDFRRYTLEKNNIRIHYDLIREDGSVIRVEEQPKLEISNGSFLLERHFSLQNLTASEELYHQDQKMNPGKNRVQQLFDLWSEPPAQDFQISGHGSRYWLDRSGCGTCHEMDKAMVGPSYQQIANRYIESDSIVEVLTHRIKNGSQGQWGEAVMIPHPHVNEDDIADMLAFILSLRTEEAPPDNFKKPAKKKNQSARRATVPGFGAALEGVHPTVDLIAIRPGNFRPRVGGMDFDEQGNLYVSTWDSLGSVFKLSGVESGDTNQVMVTEVASGLGEPLGLKVVDDGILVAQRNEITKLMDTDDDGLVDVYEAFCDQFGVTQDFHEYTYGLIEKDGFIYASLGLAMRLMQHELQHPDRGTLIRIEPSGQFEKIVDGLRQPNGIGLGPDGEIFITENQGRWVPACKLIHARQGDFHGCLKESGGRFANRTVADPVVWLPQDEIGNSPSQPLLVKDGLFKGQMIFGDVTHGGIKRVSLDQVNGQYQGCAFRFCQGLEAGINRMAYGPDDRLYVGGVGMHGGWSHRETQYGLQCLAFNDHIPMDIHSVVATRDGFEVLFTLPVEKSLLGDLPSLIEIHSWRYQPTEKYGGPKLDWQKDQVAELEVSEMGKRITLKLSERREKHVYHFFFSPKITSESGQGLWAGDAWYTLNQIPKDNNL